MQHLIPNLNRVSMQQRSRSIPNPIKLFTEFVENSELVYSLAKRDFVNRFKGSLLGLGWALAQPLIVMATYTILFSGVFTVRRGIDMGTNSIEFVTNIYLGLILHAFLIECMSRAATLMQVNVNFVKKVVFPVHCLPMAVSLTALFQLLVGLVLYIIAVNLFFGWSSATLLLLPAALFPLVLFALGLAYFISALGVYIRDMGQIIALSATLLLFGSPIFYHRSSLPDKLQSASLFFPLTIPIEFIRALSGPLEQIQIAAILIYTAASFVFVALGFWFFQRVRPSFSDVL